MWTVIIVSFFQHFILFHRFWLRPKLSNVFQINYNLWNSVLSDLLVIYNVKMWQMCHFFLRHVKTGVVLFCYQLPEEKFQRASILVSHFFFPKQCEGRCNYTKHLPSNAFCSSRKEHGMSNMLWTLFDQILKKKNFFFSKFQKNWSFFAKFGTRINWFIITSQLTFSCSGSRIETFEKGVKYVQS